MEWDLDFIGQSLCLGNQDRMLGKGSDPENCITCRANRDCPEFVPPPQVYYAMNVLRYATVPGSFNVARPFQAGIVAWKLTERRFNKLVDVGQELANGTLQLFTGQTVAKDLSLVDLRLGPCEDTGYQKYEIAVAEGVAVARSGQQIQDYVVRNIWGVPENRATDEQLEEVCGRRQANLTYLQADIDRCLDQWRQAKRAGGPGQDNLGQLNGAGQDATAGLAGLLDEVSAPETAAAPAADSPFDAPQPDSSTATSVASSAAEPLLPPSPAEQEAAAGPGGLGQFAPPADVLAPPEPAPAAAGPAMSFADLMEQIDQT
jgi:HAMP domain-containing protein